MKALKYTLLVLLGVVAMSCTESLPEDNSQRFAAKVVADVDAAVTLPVVDISIMHKVSRWLECADDEAARREVEDMYFSKIAPRVSEGKVTVITKSDDVVVEVQHNNIPIGEAGAEWSIDANSSISGRRVTLTNLDGESWSCELTKKNGDVVYSYEVEPLGVDSYNVLLDCTIEMAYVNSPVVAQHVVSESKINISSTVVPPYPVGELLRVVEGTYNIELLSGEREVIAGDNIAVTYSEEVDKSLVYSDYMYNGFNPVIYFRGKSFKYQDIYSLYCYYE